MNKQHRKMEIRSSLNILCEQSLIFESKNNIISINLNQFYNTCLYSLKSENLFLLISL